MVRPPSPSRSAVTLFRRAFGAPPTSAASAPGRVNLIGEHLDYNGGPVLPAAINRRTAVAVGPASAWHFVSGIDERVHHRTIDEPMRQEWTDYLVGVIRELRALGMPLTGGRVAVATSLPIGAGLSSSAALTVAAARALSALAGRQLTAEQLEDVAYRAEHDQVGVRCGHMDQTIAAFARPGTALFFDTRTGRRRHVPMVQNIWVVETGQSHRLTGGALNERRAECEAALVQLRTRWPDLKVLAGLSADDLPSAEAMLPAPLFRRVRHIVTETARTYAAVDALIANDAEALGRLLLQGHTSLHQDYESTIAEADFIVHAAMRHGAYGARLTGAGWGGAVLVLAPPAAEREVLTGISADFHAHYGREPAIWGSKASAGVRREATIA